MIGHWLQVKSRGEPHLFYELTSEVIFGEHSCFCLTETGVQIAESNSPAVADNDGNGAAQFFAPQMAGWSTAPAASNPVPVLQPFWDGQRHELRFGDTLVKKFKWRASNQEKVLAAFEEEGWPARIDDPLPPHPDIDSKRRLGDTIKCLNRNQLAAVIRFVGDGSGEGVIWEFQLRTEGVRKPR